MKSTGIVRKVDELGRVVIPSELRRTMDIEEKDPMEIFTDNDTIILKKYVSHRSCAVTGTISSENKTYGNNKIVLSPEGAKILLRELQDSMLVKL
jgi:AbrB family transcriptional regulator, transcriptional pleiotropic regulator of transition state genes